MTDKQPNSRQRAYLRRENRKWPAHLKPVPADDWPAEMVRARNESTLIGLWRSRRYLVMGFAEPDGILRLSVQRTEWQAAHANFADRIPWDDMQQIKAEAGYGDRTAVEIYPPDSEIVNVANMRHLWVMPAGRFVKFMWRKED